MHVNCKRKKIVIAIDFCIGNHEMQTFHCNVANELSKQNLVLLVLQGTGGPRIVPFYVLEKQWCNAKQYYARHTL